MHPSAVTEPEQPTNGSQIESPTVPRTATPQKPQLNVNIRRKLEKVISTEIDPDMVIALDHLSTFYSENTLASRLNLRTQLEGQCVQVQNDFLSQYSLIQEKLQLIENDINQMKARCDSMQTTMDQTLNTSGTLIKRANHLFESSQRHVIKKEIITAFLDRFQLSNQQLEVLRVTIIIDISFFNALKEVYRINADCHRLLQTSHSNAGLEIMDALRDPVDTAYRSLYMWVKSECRSLDSDAPRIDPLLICGFEALQARPILLGYCHKEVGDTRNRAVKRGFMTALTMGGPNGMPRPIEIHAHDEYRYVSDMAAWVHQALAFESELIHALTKTAPVSKVNKKYTETSLQILHKALQDVCIPLKARLMQVLSMKLDDELIDKLHGVLDFYRSSFQELLGPDAPITKTFEE